jgi:hypothetical protein
MRLIYSVLLIVFHSANALSAPCDIGEDQIIGTWSAAGKYGEFEEMEFSREGNRRIFNSWMHHRPYISDGSWSLKNCILHIAHPTEQALSYDFNVRMKHHDSMTLKGKGEPEAKYRRFKHK